MKKEKFYVGIVRGFLAVIMFIALVVGVNLYNVDNYFLDPKGLVRSINVKGMVDEVVDDAKENLYDSSRFQSLNISEEEFDELLETVLEQDFVEYYLESVMEAEIYGESDYDSDTMRDMLNDSFDEFCEKYPQYSDVDREAIFDEILEPIDSFIEETEELHDEEDNEILRIIPSVKETVHRVFILCVIVLAVCAVTDLLIHRNKGTALRSIGITGVVSQVISFAGMMGLYYLFIAEVNSILGNTTDQSGIMEMNMIGGLAYKSYMSAAVVAAVSIVLIIAGCLISAEYRSSEDEDDFETVSEEDYLN